MQPFSYFSVEYLAAPAPRETRDETDSTAQSFVRSDVLCIAHKQSTQSSVAYQNFSKAKPRAGSQGGLGG